MSAREKSSETEAQITVSGAVKLSEADISRMSSEAEGFAEEDAQAKRVAMNRHRLEIAALDAVYDVEDRAEIAEKLSAAEKATVRAEAAAVHAWLNSHGVEASMEAVDAEWGRFTERVNPILDQHRSKPPKPPPGEEEGGEGEEGDDADDDDDDDDTKSATPDEQKLDAALDKESKEEL